LQNIRISIPPTQTTLLGQLPAFGYEIEHFNRVISIQGKWDLIVQGTGTPDMPYSRQISITVGSSKTTSYELGYSITASVSVLFASVESTMSANFGQSFTFSEETTTTETFTIAPQKGRVSGCWWQGAFDCTYTYNARFVPKKEYANITAHPGYIESSALSLFEMWVFGVGGRNKQQIEKFRSRDNTFVATQYPPADNRSSLEYNKFDLK
jgi:hypothetical protein